MALPAGWTDDAILEAALVGPWWVPSPVADTRTIENDGWRQRLTPSLRQGGLNEIGFTKIEARDADAFIDRMLAEFGDIRFRWAITPGSSPPDLADRLAARGFACVTIRAMARDTSPIAAKTGNVERVDESTVVAYTEVMAEGWSMDPAQLLSVHRGMLRIPDAYRLFVVREQGKVVGVAAYSAARGSAYQMGALVLPAHRGRGHYAALVAARIADAASRGLTLATSQAREETSAPILEKLGFATLCRFPVFRLP